MKLKRLWISGFQSFGGEPTEIEFANSVYLIGPNGSGKTAVLEALCRMFSFNSNLKRILPSDFHVPLNEDKSKIFIEREFWVEADFEFPELEDEADEGFSIPQNFSHMRLNSPDGNPTVRFRLDAKLDFENEIDSTFNYVLEVDDDDAPVSMTTVSKQERNSIHVHYLPARRNPSDHISYSTSSLIGRMLISGDWKESRDEILLLTKKINKTLDENSSAASVSKHMDEQWKLLHKGDFFVDASILFGNDELGSLFRLLSIGFLPSHNQTPVDYSLLSDGQKSLLYLSLVLTAYEVGRDVLSGENDNFDIDKLRPPIFTLIAMEEPENSLSSHLLGRVLKRLTEFSTKSDTQVVVATHSPSLMTRIEPEDVRYLRLDDIRQTQVKMIKMPKSNGEAYKFVRNAVQAFPELYFSRMVILGEGDSEQIVIKRLLQARGIGFDISAISIAPLGGRHVNHFWKLLHGLDIPFITLLDLDLCRYHGGWGRIRYVTKQLIKYKPKDKQLTQDQVEELPKWNDKTSFIDSGKDWIEYLEGRSVYFSSPLDLDFSMMCSFPESYGAKQNEPTDNELVSVLGKSHEHDEHYSKKEKLYFSDYHRLFKLGSKPAEHLKAFSSLDDGELLGNIDQVYERLLDEVQAVLESLPE